MTGSFLQAVLRNPRYDFLSWPSLNQQLFLQELLDVCERSPLPLSTLAKLDSLYRLTGKRNSEERFKWCMICLKCGRAEILRDAADFAVSQGRMKFVRPLYRALLTTSIPGGRELGIGTFAANREIYHPICRKMVANDISFAIRETNEKSPSKVEDQSSFVRGVGFGLGIAAVAGFILFKALRK